MKKEYMLWLMGRMCIIVGISIISTDLYLLWGILEYNIPLYQDFFWLLFLGFGNICMGFNLNKESKEIL